MYKVILRGKKLISLRMKSASQPRSYHAWLDFAGDQPVVVSKILRDWQDKLSDQFLQFNDREVLQGAGKSH